MIISTKFFFRVRGKKALLLHVNVIISTKTIRPISFQGPSQITPALCRPQTRTKEPIPDTFLPAFHSIWWTPKNFVRRVFSWDFTLS